MTANYSLSNQDLRGPYSRHVEAICARHDHAMENSGASHAVIFSGNPKYAFLDDMSYPFNANPHFLSWVPLTELPLSYIVYTPGEKPVLIYYQPHDYWHVVPGEPDGFWVEQFDVRIVRDTDDVAQHLPAARDKCILIGDIDDDALAFGIDRINPSSAMHILHYARAIKTEYELACLRMASQRGVTGHVAAEAAFREGGSEFDIHQAYCKAVSHTESELPYGNIVALNNHSAVLHYTDFERTPPAIAKSFLIDAGARVHGYASDITRTYANDDTRFSELVARMDRLQLDIIHKIGIGLDYSSLHVDTHRMIAGLLVDARIATGDVDTLLSTGVTSAFFPHGLGHLLGIQVHDIGGHMVDESGNFLDPPSGHPFLRLTRTLEENMVFTIEPGVYVIDMLLENLRGTSAESHVNWDSVDWLRPFGGIRIEDNVRVTAAGAENMTRDAFAAIA